MTLRPIRISEAEGHEEIEMIDFPREAWLKHVATFSEIGGPKKVLAWVRFVFSKPTAYNRIRRA